MTLLTWTIFIVAALLEVGGDAAIRRGLQGGGLLFILAGFAVLGSYGLVVNSVKWDFSKLLAVYFQGDGACFDVARDLNHYYWRPHYSVRPPIIGGVFPLTSE